MDRILAESQLAAFTKRARARFVGTNTNGGHVYRNDAGLLFVVVGIGAGRVRIRVVRGKCNC